MSFLDLALEGIPDWLVRASTPWREGGGDDGGGWWNGLQLGCQRRAHYYREPVPDGVRSGSCEQVRLMRACRVIRLFGRFSELKKMVAAVSASILAMMHSFFIFVLVMAICEYHSFAVQPFALIQDDYESCRAFSQPGTSIMKKLKSFPIHSCQHEIKSISLVVFDIRFFLYSKNLLHI